MHTIQNQCSFIAYGFRTLSVLFWYPFILLPETPGSPAQPHPVEKRLGRAIGEAGDRAEVTGPSLVEWEQWKAMVAEERK